MSAASCHGLALRGLAIVALAAHAGGAAEAQDYTHPRDMGLPAPAFERPDPDEMRVQLDNGLVAYVAEDRRAPLANVTAYIGVGSGHGAPGEAEIVAAAMRRGSVTRANERFWDSLDEVGATHTVTLGREEIVVELDVPASDAWRALDMMAALLAAPAFDSLPSRVPPGLTLDALVDRAPSMDAAVAVFDRLLFEGHPFDPTVTRDDVVAARQRAPDFHRRNVVPSNVVLAVAGDFDAEEAKRQVDLSFAWWGGEPAPVPLAFSPIDAGSSRRVVLRDADKLQGWVVIGHELPVVPDRDQASLHVMDYILGAYHLDSRLFRESREKRGLTNDNSSFLEPGVRGPGSYTMRTYGRPEVVRLLVDLTFRELEKIRETLPDETEMFVARGALIDGLYATRYATGLDAARSYAREWLHRGGHEWSAGYPDRIRGVTAADVQAAARKYLDPQRMIVSVIGPLDAISAATPIEAEPQLDAWGSVERLSGR